MPLGRTAAVTTLSSIFSFSSCKSTSLKSLFITFVKWLLFFKNPLPWTLWDQNPERNEPPKKYWAIANLPTGRVCVWTSLEQGGKCSLWGCVSPWSHCRLPTSIWVPFCSTFNWASAPVLCSGRVCTLVFFWGNAFFLSPQIPGAWRSAFLICCCSGNRSTGSHGS